VNAKHFIQTKVSLEPFGPGTQYDLKEDQDKPDQGKKPPDYAQVIGERIGRQKGRQPEDEGYGNEKD
jgi:hypothetical protein